MGHRASRFDLFHVVLVDVLSFIRNGAIFLVWVTWLFFSLSFFTFFVDGLVSPVLMGADQVTSAHAAVYDLIDYDNYDLHV